ncbi:MAG TPA: hypothetical protein VK638_19605, partial [Edaphobacter sp.]|nr:hypothetical protein [Edaphobacter sp.]
PSCCEFQGGVYACATITATLLSRSFALHLALSLIENAPVIPARQTFFPLFFFLFFMIFVPALGFLFFAFFSFFFWVARFGSARISA